ncbi:DUF6220 domain-containing protein [Halomicrobium urmianum]|uniref:DUF6220 domain-containing protein n=1 Tax=Halomicrobium urmianum TaxID=1586233 RepID=UPI003571236F
MDFVHYFQYLPLGLFPLALIGRVPRGLKLLPVGLVLLIEVQYVTSELFGSLVGAIHPVSAFIILWTAMHTTRRAWDNT